ncbi:MAG: hypothetical protein QXN05_04525 [Acidilobaceae archaeon]
MSVKLIVESSRSRTGKHIEKKMAFVVSKDSVKAFDESFCIETELVKPVYSKGRACVISVEVSPESYAVQLRLVRNLYGRVKGYINVYDERGTLLYKAVIRKLKVRPSLGDYRYHWVVERVIEYLKLNKVLKRYKLSSRLYRTLDHV